MGKEFTIVLTLAIIAVILGLWTGFALLEDMNEPKKAIYVCCPHSAARIEEIEDEANT